MAEPNLHRGDGFTSEEKILRLEVKPDKITIFVDDVPCKDRVIHHLISSLQKLNYIVPANGSRPPNPAELVAGSELSKGAKDGSFLAMTLKDSYSGDQPVWNSPLDIQAVRYCDIRNVTETMRDLLSKFDQPIDLKTLCYLAAKSALRHLKLPENWTSIAMLDELNAYQNVIQRFGDVDSEPIQGENR